MNKGFLQRLQEIRLKDIGHIFLFLLAVIPAFVYKKTHRPFWLICEYGEEARDNGYYFYEYMIRNHPEQDVIYAIRTSSYDYPRVHALGKTVDYGSFMHWVTYLAAQANISSQKGGKPNAAVCYLLEVYGHLNNNRVFLQHGIIKDDMPYIYYGNARFSLFTVSTEREYEYVAGKFGYPPGVVQKLGLCRFDDLNDESDGRRIVVMPTWRQWLTHKSGSGAALFRESEYYTAWNGFLRSEELRAMLDRYDLQLCFYPHWEMQRFGEEFSGIGTGRIRFATWPEADVHDLLKKGAMLVTDYSSVAMDFAYLGKPVLYYQFDVDRFRKSHLEEGYFSYTEDGFGPVLYCEEDLFRAMRDAIERNFALTDVYRRRIDSFFDLRDHGNCERTYHAVCGLVGKHK